MSLPAASGPAGQEARGAIRGRQQTNRRYVRIVNPVSKPVVKLKLARRWVAEGRASWVTEDAELRLTQGPDHRAYAACAKQKLTATNAGYDRIKSGFHWLRGQSAGHVVMVTERGPDSL